MKTEPLLWMISVQGTIILMTIYFFYRVLRSNKKENNL